MTYAESIILAFIQGVTEFLPVSSSGHLALASAVMEVPGKTLAFDIMLHLGTLLAVLLVYGGDILSLASGVLKGRRRSVNMAIALAVASVPAGVVGVFLSRGVERISGMPLVVSTLMLLTGAVLFLTRFPQKGNREPGLACGLLTGVFQAVAVLPGVSRSGMTISAGLFRGVDRAAAARFSFLLSVPAILGAAVLELPKAEWNTPIGVLAAGFAVSALVGYGSLRLLVRFVQAGALHRFCWYCWAVGISGILVSVLGTGV